MSDENLGIVGIIGRFKPMHNGAASILETACERAEKVKIGIGSSNKIDFRNPWTPEETQEMIEAYLAQRFNNYTFHYIPDFGNEKLWRAEVVKQMGTLDFFVTGNPYVAKILKDSYTIEDSVKFVGKENHLQISGTIVRGRMALPDGAYKSLIPKEVAKWLDENDRLEKFREEWGEQTLKATPPGNKWKEPTLAEEYMRVHGPGSDIKKN